MKKSNKSNKKLFLGLGIGALLYYLFYSDDNEKKPLPIPIPDNITPTPNGVINTYTIMSGDTLFLIAQKKLGDGNRWRDIHQLNIDVIPNANLIYPGQVLKLPVR